MFVILLTCLMPLIMPEVLLLVRPNMEAFKGNYEAACSSHEMVLLYKKESLLQGWFAKKKMMFIITHFPVFFLGWCQGLCFQNAQGWRHNWTVGTGRHPPQSCACGTFIEISSEEQSGKCLFTIQGLDKAILLAFLIFVYFHLYAEQGPSSCQIAVGGSSEAALSMIAQSCGLHEALPCTCCKTQVLFLTNCLFLNST